jgi:hypothetical protein
METYDIDAKIEETARMLAADTEYTLQDLKALQAIAPNPHSARVFNRAVGLREEPHGATEGR